MKVRSRTCVTLLVAAVSVFAWTDALFAQVTVITSGGFRAPYLEVLPEFERTTGITVTTLTGQSQGSTPNAIGVQLRRGVTADVVIMSREGLTDLAADGRIVPGSDIDLAQTPLGVAVRNGAPRPDISSVQRFTEMLLGAKSVTFPNSTTGIYLVSRLFPQLGTSDAVARKTTNVGVAAVARGETEVAIQPASELLHVAGVNYVGSIPPELQFISIFSAAVVSGSSQVDASKRLISYLVSANAVKAIESYGMQPPTTHSR